MKLDAMGKVICTDVLVVGHGIAGTSSGILVKEENPNLKVLLVDKASTGYGGKANKGGCVFIDTPDGEDPEKITEWHVKKTYEYLVDQDQNRNFIFSTRKIINKLGTWGVEFFHNPDGSLKYRPSCPQPWQLTAVESNFLLKMTQHAKRLGCEFMDKITITDLLTDGQRVVGAVGFSLLDGEKYIFKAKAVMLACGDQNYRVTPMWACGRGDGTAAAFRAGATMQNAEFGTFFQTMRRDAPCGALYSENALYNAKGEYISPKYRPWLNNPEDDKYFGSGAYDINAAVIIGMYKETMDGNGPIYFDKSKDQFSEKVAKYTESPTYYNRPKFVRFRQANAKNWAKGMNPEYGNLIPMTVSLIGEQSPVKVDHEMQTSLEGLWASGDICYNGSNAAAAVPAPPGRFRGSGLAFAVFGAMCAAPKLASYAAQASEPDVNPDQAQKLFDDVWSAYQRTGGVDVMEIVEGVKKVMTQVKYSLFLRQDRMEEALGLILKEKEKLSNMTAQDYHYLCSANEARSMVLSAEMHFRSAMLRKETRGWFVREDYPDRDDKNWLKYINFTKAKNDEIDSDFEFWTEDCPIEKYKYQPE